jgi:hypothetical protein
MHDVAVGEDIAVRRDDDPRSRAHTTVHGSLRPPADRDAHHGGTHGLDGRHDRPRIGVQERLLIERIPVGLDGRGPGVRELVIGDQLDQRTSVRRGHPRLLDHATCPPRLPRRATRPHRIPPVLVRFPSFRPRRLSEGIEPALEFDLRHGPDHLIDDPSLLDEQEGRDRMDFKAPRQPGLFVHVHLGEGDRPARRPYQILEHRGDDPTRAAPRGPEVYDQELRGLRPAFPPSRAPSDEASRARPATPPSSFGSCSRLLALETPLTAPRMPRRRVAPDGPGPQCRRPSTPVPTMDPTSHSGQECKAVRMTRRDSTRVARRSTRTFSP